MTCPPDCNIFQKIQQAIKGKSSPYRDTLETLTGSPPLGVHNVPAWALGRPGGFSAAAMNIGGGMIGRDKNYSGEDYIGEEILTHEFGHQLDPNVNLGSGKHPEARQQFDQWRGQHPEMPVRGYAATNPNEQFAEAFKDAMRFIRNNSPKLQSPTPGDYIPRMTPGSEVLLDWLLDQPMYANHPLRAMRQRKAVKFEKPQMAVADAVKQIAAKRK